MKKKKFPLPGRERLGERVTVKREPLYPLPGEGEYFGALIVN